MRVLVLTKIFPNRVEPHSSPFNRQQFTALSRWCDVDVLATIPWFPGSRGFSRWSRAGRLRGVPALERIDNLSVFHPRYAYLPKIGSAVAGPLYVASLAPHVLQFRGGADVLLGSWAYPDGYAAVVLARLLGVPAVVKVHGSDVNVLANDPAARDRLGWALAQAARVVAVSRPLAVRVAALGVDPARVTVVRNGVDPALFFPRDRRAARAKLGLGSAPAVLYVGRLDPDKGVLDLVRAFQHPSLRHTELWLVGSGPAADDCQRLAGELGVRLVLRGERPHREIPEYLAASDVLALPSVAEGSPNVVSEALASGRRVVASNVGGIPDLVTCGVLGELVPPRDPAALGQALGTAVSRPHDPEYVARVAAIPTWQESARHLYQVLLEVTGLGRREAAA